jgi:hypothetical protein
MNSAKLTTTSGHSWSTSINGTFESIEAYFLGKFFNVGAYPIETMEQVTTVEVFEQNGDLTGISRL